MITDNYITELVNAALSTDELFIVDISVDPGNKIKVVLDSDKTVSISDCISVSRAIEQELDRDTEDFSLEVTSAGLGQPLKLMRQYSKYIGKNLEVTDESGNKFSGELKNVNSDFIELLEVSKKSGKRKSGLNDLVLHKLQVANIIKAQAIVTI